MAIKKLILTKTSILFLAIGMLLVPVVSAGSLFPSYSNTFTSPTGKLIAAQWDSLHSQYPSAYKPTNAQIYTENATACGDCNANWAVLLSIPIQPHFTPAPTILNLKTEMYNNLIVPPKSSSIQDLSKLINFGYKDTSQIAACGNCSGQLFENPFKIQY